MMRFVELKVLCFLVADVRILSRQIELKNLGVILQMHSELETQLPLRFRR